MTETRKLRVFLCHSSQDKPIVRELYQRLNAEGWIDPWLDEEKLLPGQDWDLEIEKAVEVADAVIVCLSNNSVTKEGYVQKELRKVLDVSDEKPEGEIFVIPIRIDDVQIPRRLKMWQYVDLFPNDRKISSYNRVIGSLKKRAENIPQSIVPDLSGGIAIEAQIFYNEGSSPISVWYVAKSGKTIRELLSEIKKEYREELLDDIKNYEISFKLPLNFPVDNLNTEDGAIILFHPMTSPKNDIVKNQRIEKSLPTLVTSPVVNVSKISEYKERPLPDEIMSEIAKLPEYQKEIALSSYEGLKIKWRLGLLSFIREDDIVHLGLTSDKNSMLTVMCDVKLADYPEIKLLKKKDELWVSGKSPKYPIFNM